MDSRTNISDQEKMASLGAGGALALLGTGLLLRGRVVPALGALAAGGALLYRGKSGHCGVYEKMGVDTAHTDGAQTAEAPQGSGKAQDSPVKLAHAVTIDKPASELYAFWRDTANFSKFMPHIESVEASGSRLKWTAQGPAGQKLHWESEIIEEKPGELLRWETKGTGGIAGAALPMQGQLSLKELAHDRGTEVKLEMTYDPTAGALGAALATLFKALPSQFVLESLRRFKQLMETGEIAHAQNQPA
jgi:uncharacterized membrane protein